jgi:hypothetical protein
MSNKHWCWKNEQHLNTIRILTTVCLYVIGNFGTPTSVSISQGILFHYNLVKFKGGDKHGCWVLTYFCFCLAPMRNANTVYTNNSICSIATQWAMESKAKLLLLSLWLWLSTTKHHYCKWYFKSNCDGLTRLEQFRHHKGLASGYSKPRQEDLHWSHPGANFLKLFLRYWRSIKLSWPDLMFTCR